MAGIKVNNKSKKQATIEIDGVVGYWDWNKTPPDKNTKDGLKKELKAIAEIQADEILVKINSPGGSVDHGLAIHDLLVEHSAKVITDVYGMTASIATVIAMAGDERRMSDNALAMIHLPSMMAWGNKNEFEAGLELLKQVEDRIANIYAKRGAKKAEDYKAMMARNGGNGIWMDADEMLDSGLITEAYEPVRMAAFYNPADYGLPEIPEDKLPENFSTKPTGLKNRLIQTIKDFFEPQPDPEEANQTDKKDTTMENNNQNPQEEQSLESRIAQLEEKLNRLVDELLPADQEEDQEDGDVENTDTETTEPAEEEQGITMEQRFQNLENELQAARDEIENLKNTPAAEDTHGETDDHQEDPEDYMNLDIHEKARAKSVPKK